MSATGTTGRTLIAGVIGRPVAHSLSPLIHSAWIAAAGLDAVYVPLSPPEGGLGGLMLGLKGSGVRGFNVTLPFKEQALVISATADPFARAAGAANLLLFDEDGDLEARNTDGEGLLAAFREQAPDFSPEKGPIVILGAGGAARGAAAALLARHAPEIRIVNRTLSRAEELAEVFGRSAQAFPFAGARKAFEGAAAVINATSAGLDGTEGFVLPLDALPDDAVAMDMVYKPLITPFLQAAKARGLPVVDGLAMLIGQAVPSFEALFGQPPPPEVDVRALALAALRGVIVLGLTGSIGMGKSTTVGLFEEAGARVWEGSDAVVHQLYGPGGAAVAPVEAAFPGVTGAAGVDRARLAKRVSADPEALRRLEAIVHPLVAADRERFLAENADAALAVLDIPLLFEVGADRQVDAVLTVSAPAEVQRARVLARPGMTAEKFETLLARQLPDAEKRARADFVLETDKGLDAARTEVRRIMAALAAPGWRSRRRA